MDIRPAHAGDIPQLLGLIRRYWDFEGIEGFSALRIELLLKDLLAAPAARGTIWVADQQRSLVAYLIVVLLVSIEHQGVVAEIDEFFVLPEARSRGTGSQLLAAAEADLARRNCVRLQLQLRSGNAPARAFYERLGFAARAGYELLDKPLG
jgi:ribosomal protein S18 acetylase RimI-like enzyme